MADGRDVCVEWDERAALGIVLASEGYPGAYGKGFPIGGLEGLDGVYHMGTKRDGDRIVTSGGRVLFVVGRVLRWPRARAGGAGPGREDRLPEPSSTAPTSAIAPLDDRQ